MIFNSGFEFQEQKRKMNNRNAVRLLLLSFVFLGVVLSVNLVSAAVNAGAIGNVTFSNNATGSNSSLQAYDEGVFFLNWTTGEASGAVTYDVWVYSNDSTYSALFNVTANNSVIGSSLNSTSGGGFHFTNTTESNYTFIIQATNSTDSYNASNISIYVDRTAPAITLDGNYTNATQKKNTGTITLNISVTDASAGIVGSTCLIDVNGTGVSNQTVAVTRDASGAVGRGWCNSSVINLTGVGDGNKTINVWVNDSVNVFGINNSFVVWVDTTGPTASPTCSPTTVQTGDTFPCSCSGSDAGVSGLTFAGSSSSPDGTGIPSSTGTFTYSCLATDGLGNTGTASAQYIVTQVPSTGSGGGSGGSSSSSSGAVALPSHTFTEVSPGSAQVKKYTDPDLGLKEISINVNSEAQNVRVTVTKYDSKPAEVTKEKSGKVFQYMQINVDNVAGKLDKATITTKVKKSWVEENGLDKDKVSVFKYDETSDQWNELTTSFDSEDDTYYYYTADVTSFSFFAISEKALVEGEGTPADDTTPVTPSQPEDTGSSNTWIWVVLGIIVIAAIIGGGVAMKKRE